MSWSILMLFSILLFNLLAATRFSFTLFRRAAAYLAGGSRAVLIVGAGAAGDAAMQFLRSSPYGVRRVIGFLDDDAFKHGKLIHGVPVLGALAELDRVYLSSKFDELLLAFDAVPETQLAVWHSFARRNGIIISSFTVGSHPRLENRAEPAASLSVSS
ncbi:MAG: hypothetical protein JOZ29_20675 [Deltaproteobacteria bacterium]|nr:hypothetical protein [Deltaproteobacteria bacterium]